MIGAWLEEVASTRARVIEQACEAAIADGRYGVLVESHLDLAGFKITAGPDPSVPYGQIHER
jgi:hypothetical protein